MSLRTGNYCGFTVEQRELGIAIITFNRPESLNAQPRR
jgi:enoyl-CoA hydratase/carnithine racemase